VTSVLHESSYPLYPTPKCGIGERKMLGSIHSDQRCRICNSTFRDDKRNGLSCPQHPEERATSFKIMFKGICKRYHSYDEAEKILIVLRYQYQQNKFDRREWSQGHPLGFQKLAEEWLERKKQVVKHKHYVNLKRCINKACIAWGQKSIKEIGYAEIEDFLFSEKDIAEKTRFNMRSCLNDFLTSLRKRKVLTWAEMPEVPTVSYEMEYRNTLQGSDQVRVLTEVKRISYEFNPRIWIGIKFLMTYFNTRPGELLRIREGDIKLERRKIVIPHPKEKKPKNMSLTSADVQLLKTIPKGFPELFFFRHLTSRNGCVPGEQFGPEYLHRYWKMACDNLGIKDVGLYGGTKHSSMCNSKRTREDVKEASMISSSSSLGRYLRHNDEKCREIYNETWKNTSDNALTMDFEDNLNSTMRSTLDTKVLKDK